MKVLRIFLNPTGETYIDMGAGDDFNMHAWYGAMRKDGGALAQYGFIPIASIHHVLVLDVEARATTLTVYPGGKPN